MPSIDTSVIVSGLSTLAPRYDLLLCDVWGVLHDGVASFAEAAEALTRFRSGGGTVLLISNAPRPGDFVVPLLDALGVPRSAFDGIVTSGDLALEAIRERPGRPLHHLGPARDLSLFEGLDTRLVPLEEADYVVCTGLLDDDNETPEDYREHLAAMRARDLWLLCANPDLVVERGARLIPCAGAVAALYEELGGTAFYPGKPHRPIYEAALRHGAALRGGDIPLARILAVGDAIRTDIVGADRFGIDSLLVARGIHAGELGPIGRGAALDSELTRAFLARQDARPTAVIDALRW